MEHDFIEYVKKYFKCQQHANLYFQSSQALHLMQALWLFSRWALDLIGKIWPTSLGGHKFIIKATKYFTKLVEAIPMISTKGPKIAEFIEHHIIYHFGISARIVIDNGKN